MSKIRFQVVPPIHRGEQPIFVTGSHPALGDWLPEKALQLAWRPPFHVGEIEADTGTHFEYKIHRGSWETEAVDAYGDVPGNRAHEVWLDGTVHVTIADWKDRYRGRLTRERVPSRVLAGGRDLLIWLPQSYATHRNRRFPVVVLNDGSNIFDPDTSPFSGIDWAADEWVTKLSADGVMSESLVVGVCHPDGFTESNDSQRDFDLSPELGGAAYAQFLATELIPHLDTHYRTLPEPSARVLGGASLGALLAFFVAIHHPGVFGNFACLSTNFGDMSRSTPESAGELQALAAEPALATGARMYFDYGTVGIETDNAPYHQFLAELLTTKGWRQGEDFEICQVEGGTHDELSWRQRIGSALRFLAR